MSHVFLVGSQYRPWQAQSQCTQWLQVHRADGDGALRTLAGNGTGARIWFSSRTHQIAAGSAEPGGFDCRGLVKCRLLTAADGTTGGSCGAGDVPAIGSAVPTRHGLAINGAQASEIFGRADCAPSRRPSGFGAHRPKANRI